MRRRRFLELSALASGTLLPSCEKFKNDQKSKPKQLTWSGIVFGRASSIQFQQISEVQAEQLFPVLTLEAQRLERLFSLSDSYSPLNLLNLTGKVHADLEFTTLISRALGFARRTEGLFDPTIQSYWLKLAAGYQMTPQQQEDALKLVNFRNLDCQAAKVSFMEKGMALTLDGIAPGYITDHLATILQERGFENVLLNLGEYRAIGARQGGKPWKIPLSHDVQFGDMGGKILELSNEALSITTGQTFPFPNSEKHHLLNPKKGDSPPAHRTIAITASDSITADVLATVCAVTSPEKAAAIIERFPEARIIFDSLVS